MKPFDAITPEQIQDWKAKYGDVLNEVTIDEYRFIVKSPNRSLIELTTDYGNKGKVTEASRAIISNCVLGGDMDALEQDGGVYTALLEKCGELLKKRTASLKKI